MELVRVQPEAARGLAGGGMDDAVLRRIYDSGIVGVAVWDGAGRILEANDRFLELVGYARYELEARRLDWQRLSGGGDAQPWQAMPQRRTGGNASPIFKEYARADGTPVFVRIHSTSLGAGGRTLSIVVDVTEQRKAQDERDALLVRERAAREEAEAAVRSRDDILAIVSHDLRNPLNIIAMSANLLDSPLPEPGRRAQLGIIHRAVSRMNRLIGDLLDVTQVTSGKLRLNTGPVDVATICEEARHMFVPLLAAKGQRFECTLPGGPLQVRADHDRISQVLSNLVGNAHKFTPEGGRIELRVEAVDAFARFTVADTGPGLSASDLPHVFDRFWQARRVRRGGVGLGLPITKGIVDAHGGRIWAESAAGIGTTFFFTIPLA